MVIGLTGRNGSGKGAVAEFLKAKGFSYFSLSDVLREELRSRGEDVTRDRLVAFGRELRIRRGTDYLARRLLEELEIDRNYVVDSFRHPDEVAAFRRRNDFYLLVVTASPEIRFERIRRRNRENDPTTFEEFQRLETQEAGGEGEEGQQLAACEELGDVVIENNADLQSLNSQVSSWLRKTISRLQRPDWDSYFMKIAQVASLRSNCVKRKVAAVIVRDRRIISTGYNGTPRGTRNCFEGGCPRCNSLADSGTRLDECLCSHAEENAITQAAYHGVSVKGGSLYTTLAPCLICTKMIINAGIREVIYNLDYPLNQASLALLEEAGVVCRQLRVE